MVTEEQRARRGDAVGERTRVAQGQLGMLGRQAVHEIDRLRGGIDDQDRALLAE